MNNCQVFSPNSTLLYLARLNPKIDDLWQCLKKNVAKSIPIWYDAMAIAKEWGDLASDSDLSFRFSFVGIGIFLAELCTITANFILSKGDDSQCNWYQFQCFSKNHLIPWGSHFGNQGQAT